MFLTERISEVAQLCQGKLLKMAALRSLDMCATGTMRTHLAVTCRLYKAYLNGLLCVTCACGAGSIWLFGAEVTVPLSYSILWTEMYATDMSAPRRAACLSAWLPLPRSTGRTPVQTAEQQARLAMLHLDLVVAAITIQKEAAEGAHNYLLWRGRLAASFPIASASGPDASGEPH